ncbi:MAG: LacI family DNA-binding transcriptional regulator [Chloroflexota bacterium]
MVATLKDIAAQAGVSTTTVSRILNQRTSGVPIREETRQKVLAIALELGYQPNLMARALRGSRSALLGVIAQNITSRFQSQILRGLNDVAISRGYRVFLGNVQRKSDIAIDYGSMFEQFHADGILVVGGWANDQAALNFLLRHHAYIVGITDRVSRRDFPGVYADSHIGVQLAMDHLWALGHRKIACVFDPTIQDGQMRSDVYQAYMREHDAQAHIRLHPSGRSFHGSFLTGQALFAASDRPTAIFAVTDAIAIGLMQAAFQSGIPVPDQISIVGFDDIDLAGFTIPPLTTIRQSGVEMGQIAANLLLNMIEQKQSSADVEDIILTPTLVVRQSTAAPSSA